MKTPQPPDAPETPSTSLGYVLLCLLLQEPRSGYDLCKVLEETPMAHYSSSPGAIYPALKRLEKKGLVEAETERSHSLRPRRIYRPTEAGLEVLRAWLTRPVTRDDVMRRADEVMLRFAFLGHAADDDATRRFLEELAAASDAYADELEGYRQALLKADPPHGRLALESGLEYHRNLARWARRTRAELGRPEEFGEPED